jgi:hypothetical protein
MGLSLVILRICGTTTGRYRVYIGFAGICRVDELLFDRADLDLRVRVTRDGSLQDVAAKKSGRRVLRDALILDQPSCGGRASRQDNG